MSAILVECYLLLTKATLTVITALKYQVLCAAYKELLILEIPQSMLMFDGLLIVLKIDKYDNYSLSVLRSIP